MNLLGAYPNQLADWYAQELKSLADDALSQGDYGGGRLFAPDSATTQRVTPDFSGVPALTPGARATAESLNTGLDLLKAGYAAVLVEKNQMLANISLFLDMLHNSGDLVERLLHAAETASWVNQQSSLGGAKSFSECFAAGRGVWPSDVALLDPGAGKRWLNLDGTDRSAADVSFVQNGVYTEGIAPEVSSVDRSLPIALTWTLPNDVSANVQILQGQDWTQVSDLEDQPRIQFLVPTVNVILPNSQASKRVVRVKGSSDISNLALFLRILFVPRTRVVTYTVLSAGQQFALSPYRIDQTSLVVFGGNAGYQANTDFVVDVTQNRNILTAKPSLVGKTISVSFQESFPAYQCSVNQQSWSPALFLDPDQMISDTADGYFPVQAQDGWFPLVDELGVATGLWFQPALTLTEEYLLQVRVQGQPASGLAATLVVEFDQPRYMNGFRLAPFSAMPFHLTGIVAEGLLTTSTQTVFSGDLLLDRPASIRFSGSPVFTRKLYLTLKQENYFWKTQTLDSVSQLRDSALMKAQAVLPYSNRFITPAEPASLHGAQYDIGLKDLAGELWSMESPTVFVSGPYDITGVPSLLRLDADQTGLVSPYLLWVTTDANGNETQMLSGRGIPLGQTLSFNDSFLQQTTSGVVSTKLYIKWVLQTDVSVLTRFLLQVRPATVHIA